MERLMGVFIRLAEWKRENPKKAAFLAMLFFIWLAKKIRKMLRRPKDLTNKVVLITGGVSGIGRLLALKMKRHGCKVVVWDINETGVAEMAANVELSMKVDCTNRDVC